MIHLDGEMGSESQTAVARTPMLQPAGTGLGDADTRARGGLLNTTSTIRVLPGHRAVRRARNARVRGHQRRLGVYGPMVIAIASAIQVRGK